MPMTPRAFSAALRTALPATNVARDANVPVQTGDECPPPPVNNSCESCRDCNNQACNNNQCGADPNNPNPTTPRRPGGG
mgnify:CR=1 FL=1